jgi:hypothetical protein
VLNKSTRIEAFVNIFNLFNQQDQLAVDEEYTPDAAQPIMGGRMEDLEHLKAIDIATGQELNQTVFKNRNFAQPLVRTAPRNVQLGFRLTF